MREKYNERSNKVYIQDRISKIDHIQARRFSNLGEKALNIATEGILRHFKACSKIDVNPEPSAIREIIDDALVGRKVFAESDTQF